MLQLIYIILSFVGFFVLYFKAKNVSFIIIYFLSSLVFYFNAFEGEIFIGKLNEIGVQSYDINSTTFIVLIINMFLVVMFVSLKNRSVIYITKEEYQSERFITKVFITLVFLFSIYMAVKHNILFMSSYNKTELAEEGGSLATYFKYLATFSFVFLYTQDGAKYSLFWKVMGTVPILSTFLYGNRSYIVIAILACLFDKVFKDCYKNELTIRAYIKKHKTFVIGACILVFLVLTIKGVTGALFTGNYSLVKERLTNPDYYKQVFFVSEPNTIMRNLDTIVLNDYQVKTSSYLLLWAYFIPFATGTIQNAFGFVNFTHEYQLVLFKESNRASTFIGEAYANGGLITVGIVVFIVLLFLLLVFRGYYRCHSNIMKCTLLLIGIDTAFYFQRNSASFQMSRIRDYIYISLFLYFILVIVKSDHKIHL